MTFDSVWAAVLAALPPDLPLDERETLAQHARTLWRAAEPSRSTWTTRETLRIIAADPGHPLSAPAARTLERLARDDRHAKL